MFQYVCDESPKEFSAHVEGGTCTHKFERRKRDTTSGIFTVLTKCSCPDSKIRVAGFTVMQNKEGPKTAFIDVIRRVPIYPPTTTDAEGMAFVRCDDKDLFTSILRSDPPLLFDPRLVL
jgi:hypothetical protein